MIRLNKTAWARRWSRFKAAWRPRRKYTKKLKVNSDDIKPELEAVVTELIRETEADMEREFSRWIRNYGEKRPAGEADAQAILEGLLKLAAANREQLNGRIVSSAEVGRMYDRYYDRLAEIDELNAKTESREIARDRAKKEYEFFGKRYEVVRDKTYEIWTEERKRSRKKKTTDGEEDET